MLVVSFSIGQMENTRRRFFSSVGGKHYKYQYLEKDPFRCLVNLRRKISEQDHQHRQISYWWLVECHEYTAWSGVRWNLSEHMVWQRMFLPIDVYHANVALSMTWYQTTLWLGIILSSLQVRSPARLCRMLQIDQQAWRQLSASDWKRFWCLQ